VQSVEASDQTTGIIDKKFE